jgi:hypothetical protein
VNFGNNSCAVNGVSINKFFWLNSTNVCISINGRFIFLNTKKPEDVEELNKIASTFRSQTSYINTF